MKTLIATIALTLCITSAQAAEDWKGSPRDSSWGAGVVTGLAVVDGVYGFGLQGQVSRKIVHRGFAEDINNQVWIELGLGPVVASGLWGWNYAIQLRWDFHRDETWSFFALGGLGEPSLVQADDFSRGLVLAHCTMSSTTWPCEERSVMNSLQGASRFLFRTG